ncbi:BMP family lipoprotein [Georgenia sp. SUBG003]|uniref:BMP family lipoprotein n=1 Tax=Georgenia sp. SUBG003 TaxID=1497974 RepID=UPI003AB1D986
MVQQGCNLTIGVGFLLEDPIQSAAEANTDTNFALIDSTFSDADFNPVELENAKPILFNTASAYLAGYVAAAVTETGTVATFGGMQIPSVAIFMDGFADGVAKYNEDNGGDVQLLGWDKEAQNGSFTGDFENQANGQTLTEQFIAHRRWDDGAARPCVVLTAPAGARRRVEGVGAHRGGLTHMNSAATSTTVAMTIAPRATYSTRRQ